MTKEEKAAYAKKYREEHREEIAATRRYWYRQHKERVKQQNKEYYKTHKLPRLFDVEANKLACKKYYEDHKNDPEYKARQRASHFAWIEKNRDKWNAYLREYRKRKKLERIFGGAQDEISID